MDYLSTPKRRIIPRDYDVFIGMDVDKRSIALTYIDHSGYEKSLKMAYQPQMLISFVRNKFANKRLAFTYEAGPTGFGLYDDLKASGYDCLVVSPASVPTARGKRVRTNRLDSIKLAEQLKGGSLEGIHVPTEEYRMLRELVQLRNIHIKSVAAMKCRIKALFLRNGLLFPCQTPGGYWSENVVKQLRDLECKEVLRIKLDSLLDSLEFSKKKALEAQMSVRRIIRNNEELSDSVRYVMSLPGIGWIVASYAVARIGDWRLLGSSSEMGSFFGLVPTEDSTGEDSDRGSITRSGDPTLRSLLIQSAWSAIRKDRELNEFYQKVYKSHSNNTAARIAIVAVARKLTTRIHCVLKERREYQSRSNA